MRTIISLPSGASRNIPTLESTKMAKGESETKPHAKEGNHSHEYRVKSNHFVEDMMVVVAVEGLWA